MGSLSGHIEGQIIFSSDKKTLIFKPDNKFKPNETVTVQIFDGMRTEYGQDIEPFEFSFQIAAFDKTPNPYEYLEEFKPNYKENRLVLSKTANDTLPGNFPVLTVDTYDSTKVGDGFTFLAVAAEYEGVGYYLMMLNNDGTPHFMKELKHDYAYDFKMQQNGLLTYAHFFEHHSYTGGGNVVHKIMDSSFTVIDSVQAGNGYVAEAHDFQILPNGNYLLFGYYLIPADLSEIVDGGRPDALVCGGVIQELDANKNVVFQWRSWDHWTFEEYDWGRRSTGPIVGSWHLNTINLDIDGHIIFATPGWAKKLNRQTGEIIWNLGDVNNDFTFTNLSEEEGLSAVGGHMFHRIPNGNFLMYDNGNRQGTVSSKVNEFKLDEDNLTCELAWSWEPEEPVAGWHRGNAQRLPNGNTVIGWGGSSGKPSPAMTEVTPDGEVVHQISFDPPDVESYRAFKFPYDGGLPSDEVVIIEVVTEVNYEFIEGDSINTGVTVKINSMDGDGYNELMVRKYNYAPVYPQFGQKAPMVLPRRMILDNFAINAINADVKFDVNIWGIDDPANTIIFHRNFEGRGAFSPLATTYNSVTGQLVATTSNFGEFILAVPDFESVTYIPVPQHPVNKGEVNQEFPVKLDWSPIGYFEGFSLQVATDSIFTNLIEDKAFIASSNYILETLEPNTEYFWRIKSLNDIGESEWSSVQSFTTVPPFIQLASPADGESLQRGLEYIIRWDHNLQEDVVIQLIKAESTVSVIDTTASDGAHIWEIPSDIELADDYAIKITSTLNPDLFTINSSTFSIMDSTMTDVRLNDIPAEYSLSQNYPNPFNPTTSIRYAIPVNGNVKLTIYNTLGQGIKYLVDGYKTAGNYEISLDASDLSSGIYFYSIESGNFRQVRKMILLK
jgi:hypothetical protein